VEGLHQVPELVHRTERVAPRAVGAVRREQRDRGVAPVVDAARGRILRVELEDREQLDGRHAESLQVRDLPDQAGIGAGLPGRHARARMAGEAAHVDLRIEAKPPLRLELRHMASQQIHGGQRLERRHVAAARHPDVRSPPRSLLAQSQLREGWRASAAFPFGASPVLRGRARRGAADAGGTAGRHEAA
jgi:hypothetical protein